MVTTARTAMRSPISSNLPKAKVLWWVVNNRFKKIIGKKIEFEKYINYSSVHTDSSIGDRTSFLNKNIKKEITLKTDKHYQFGKYENR